jgi:hypothetical protein
MKSMVKAGLQLPLALVCLSREVRAQDNRDNLTRSELQEKVEKLEQRIAFLERTVERLVETRGEPSPVANAPERTEAQDNSGPKPLPFSPRSGFEMPPELVPEIGKIGAQVGLLTSGSTSPYRLNSGSFAAGFIDLPLFDKPDWLHGKISYEILVGMTQSKTTFSTTSNVAQVANLTVLTALNPNGGLQNVTAAVTGTGAAPFPVTSSTNTRLRLLQVVPFALKYTTTVFDPWRLRPYAVLGFGAYVTIHDQNPALGTPANYGIRPDANLPPDILAAIKQLFGGSAPFGGPLVAGQISQSPELESRGLPGGHGNMDLGIHSAIGAEYRVSRALSLGFDARFNRIAGTYGTFRTYGSRLGFQF